MDHAHTMTETELQGLIVKMAQDAGWMVKPNQQGASSYKNHSRALRNRTANGFPDLVLARDGEVLFIELKAQDGKLDMDQLLWSYALRPYEVIRPSDLARGRVDELLA